MKTWTPLWSSIVDSSVWGLDKDTKIVWVTMLAKKDKDGFVESSLPGLARDAVLTIGEVEKALKILESPDKYSTTPDHEGRRIKTVVGGWVVLNHQKYRDEVAKARQREQQRRWQAEYRKRLKNRGGCGPLQGEQEYVDAAQRDATETELDEIVERHLPRRVSHDNT